MFNYHYFASCLKSTKIDKKIIVIESDDWGSERIPNNRARNKLISHGVDMESNPYSRYDTLEQIEDLELMQSLFEQIENTWGKKVKLTTNFILENPDYEKVASTNFTEYFGQSFIQTYAQRDGNIDVWKKIKELELNGYIRPQFHGREHINIPLWLEELRIGNEAFRAAFDLGCFGIDAENKNLNRKNLMSAFEYFDDSQKKFVENSFIDGYSKFSEIFGFQSQSMVVPRHVWNPELNQTFTSAGVKYMQTSINQIVSCANSDENIRHYTGKKDRDTNLLFLVRNVFFEPAYDTNYDWLAKTLQKIRLLFLLNIPVIISMHRINFVGGLDLQARDNHLKKFTCLIENIIKYHPEVEFLSTDELGKLV
jgi:hypothetical protein